MAYCHQCERRFYDQRALEQHIDNSLAHRPVYECETCDKDFPSSYALQQHEENSLKHLKKLWDFVCEQCKWGCDDEKAMFKHDCDVHHYCNVHDQSFQNENNLRQHLNSAAHLGNTKRCPRCPRLFPTTSAVTLHMESGSCEGGFNRLIVDRTVHAHDRSGMITNRKLIGWTGGYVGEEDVWATDRAWNGYGYECYFCDNQYKTLGKLNAHITQIHAPKRTVQQYHCPGCGKQCVSFSQLVSHIENTRACDVKQNRQLKIGLNGGLRALTY